MKGRKPTPTVLKVLAGNPGKRAIRPEPLPPPLRADTPAEIADDRVATAEWERTIRPAIEIGLITSADRAIAIAHCEQFAAWRAAVAAAAAAPPVVAMPPSGRLTVHPARLMVGRTLTALVRLDEALGLTPTSRSRVRAGAPTSSAEDDELARILAIK